MRIMLLSPAGAGNLGGAWQYSISIKIYPTSVKIYPTSAQKYPISEQIYPISVDIYPISVEISTSNIRCFRLVVKVCEPLLS